MLIWKVPSRFLLQCTTMYQQIFFLKASNTEICTFTTSCDNLMLPNSLNLILNPWTPFLKKTRLFSFLMTQRKSDPFDPNMQIDLTQFQCCGIWLIINEQQLDIKQNFGVNHIKSHHNLISIFELQFRLVMLLSNYYSSYSYIASYLASLLEVSQLQTLVPSAHVQYNTQPQHQHSYSVSNVIHVYTLTLKSFKHTYQCMYLTQLLQLASYTACKLIF